jgi:hypothetical protein
VTAKTNGQTPFQSACAAVTGTTFTTKPRVASSVPAHRSSGGGACAVEAPIMTMHNYLANLGAWVLFVQGLIFVVCVMAFRCGIVGEISNWFKKSL